jgi:hypothetical protein
MTAPCHLCGLPAETREGVGVADQSRPFSHGPDLPTFMSSFHAKCRVARVCPACRPRLGDRLTATRAEWAGLAPATPFDRLDPA